MMVRTSAVERSCLRYCMFYIKIYRSQMKYIYIQTIYVQIFSPLANSHIKNESQMKNISAM